MLSSLFLSFTLWRVLSVIWGHVSDEVAKAAGEDLNVVRYKLKHSQTERWKAIGMLKYVLSTVGQSWELNTHAIDFLLSILDENVSRKCQWNHLDCSSYEPSLFSALQVPFSIACDLFNVFIIFLKTKCNFSGCFKGHYAYVGCSLKKEGFCCFEKCKVLTYLLLF